MLLDGPLFGKLCSVRAAITRNSIEAGGRSKTFFNARHLLIRIPNRFSGSGEPTSLVAGIRKKMCENMELSLLNCSERVLFTWKALLAVINSFIPTQVLLWEGLH